MKTSLRGSVRVSFFSPISTPSIYLVSASARCFAMAAAFTGLYLPPSVSSPSVMKEKPSPWAESANTSRSMPLPLQNNAPTRSPSKWKELKSARRRNEKSEYLQQGTWVISYHVRESELPHQVRKSQQKEK